MVTCSGVAAVLKQVPQGGRSCTAVNSGSAGLP